jgi:hypothetical protein
MSRIIKMHGELRLKTSELNLGAVSVFVLSDCLPVR